jgi:hypothetical protein
MNPDAVDQVPYSKSTLDGSIPLRWAEATISAWAPAMIWSSVRPSARRTRSRAMMSDRACIVRRLDR